MRRDWRGNPLTTASDATLAAVDRFGREVLSYGNEAAIIVKAAEAEPDCTLANTLAGALFLFLEDGTAAAKARPFLDRAKAAAPAASERERIWLAAIEAWAAGEGLRAAALHEQIIEAHPRDILSAKFGQYHFFNRGDCAGMYRLAAKVFEANRDLAYMHGMLAFGLEQTHRLAEAERAGRRAAAMETVEPWAHHAVAHVMETQGRLDEGIAWMQDHAASWADRNSFMLTHNYWHLALFLLDSDRDDEALVLYDRRVWGVYKEYAQDQINAVSLLWRLELRGVDVGDRWQDVSAYVAARGPAHLEPFHDLHYAYALLRGGHERAYGEFHRSLLQEPERRQGETAAVWRDIAVPAIEGVAAHARGEYDAAYRHLTPIEPHLQALGGSHAQRDLFVQTWLDAALRAGHASAVRPHLQARLTARPNVAVCRRWLARAV